MRTEMKKRMSVIIILLTVIAVGFATASVNGGTNETRKARRARRIIASNLEAPANQQLPCSGLSTGEGDGFVADMSGPGAGRGRGQGFSDCANVSQGRGAGRGNRMGRLGAGRGRGQG